MKYLFMPIHKLLGALILAWDWLTRPTPAQRPAGQQARIDAECRSLLLYHYRMCPFCVKTRRTIRRLNLNIDKRDPRDNPEWMADLEQNGGKRQVPCLVISENGERRFLFDSKEIIRYLESRFPADGQADAAEAA